MEAFWVYFNGLNFSGSEIESDDYFKYDMSINACPDLLLMSILLAWLADPLIMPDLTIEEEFFRQKYKIDEDASIKICEMTLTEHIGFVQQYIMFDYFDYQIGQYDRYKKSPTASSR